MQDRSTRLRSVNKNLRHHICVALNLVSIQRARAPSHQSRFTSGPYFNLAQTKTVPRRTRFS